MANITYCPPIGCLNNPSLKVSLNASHPNSKFYEAVLMAHRIIKPKYSQFLQTSHPQPSFLQSSLIQTWYLLLALAEFYDRPQGIVEN